MGHILYHSEADEKSDLKQTEPEKVVAEAAADPRVCHTLLLPRRFTSNKFTFLELKQSRKWKKLDKLLMYSSVTVENIPSNILLYEKKTSFN